MNYVYVMQPHRFAIGEFVVEAIDMEGDGNCYYALFSGPGAYQRASEYTDWKNR